MMLDSVCPHTIDLDRFGGFGWFQGTSCQARTALLAESGVLLQKLNNVGAPAGPGFQQLDGDNFSPPIW